MDSLLGNNNQFPGFSPIPKVSGLPWREHADVRLGAPRHPADPTPLLGTDEVALGPTASDIASGLPAGVGRRDADPPLPVPRGPVPRCGLLSQWGLHT